MVLGKKIILGLFLFILFVFLIAPSNSAAEITGDATRDGHLGLDDSLYILQELVGIQHLTDYDNDSYDTTIDCNDNDPDTYPDAAEVCDGQDNDCDGQMDEDFVDLGNLCSAGTGVCFTTGKYICRQDGTSTECSASSSSPETEICDGLDNDCDGLIDEEAQWANKNTPCIVGYGICQSSGIYICDQNTPAGPTICSASPNQESTENCNGVDDDCDGTIDEDLAGPLCNLQEGVCAGVRQICAGDSGYLPCNLSTYLSWDAAYQATEATCDGLDNDCDGQIDEGLISPFCELQAGVCNGSTDTCGGTSDWLGCNSDTYLNWSPNYQETETSCDGLDNDCDGQIDEGFVDFEGRYIDDDNCGFCGNSCTGTIPNAIAVCDGSAGSPRCILAQCDQNFYDVNGEFSDGCECEITSEEDLAGDSIDTNCDGIDGEVDNGIFVSESGNDTNPGSITQPKLTIQAGIDTAANEGKRDVYVARGVYQGQIILVGGVSIYGGYSPDFSNTDPAIYEVIVSGSTSANYPGTVNCIDVTGGAAGSTVFHGFNIHGYDENTKGASSYAIYVRNCDSTLRISNNTVYGGNGGDGQSGGDGSDGSVGAPGSSGINALDLYENYGIGPGECTGSYYSSGGNGGVNTCGSISTGGGNGGNRVCPVYDNLVADETDPPVVSEYGESGHNGGGIGGTPGQDVYQQIFSCTGFTVFGEVEGTDGSNGAAGDDGDQGFGCATSSGNVSLELGLWIGGSGGPGAVGKNGSGGGGGGSGAGASVHSSCFAVGFNYDNLGGTGGGGGSGGCAGTEGTAGEGGGGSFGIFVVWDTDPGTIPTINNNIIYTGNGGDGGDGGFGGKGGDGGTGAPGGLGVEDGADPAYPSFSGGNGGDGGKGGHGGGGGGGCGGSVYGIFSFGQGAADLSTWKIDNVFSLTGTGGTGGKGGLSLGNSGGSGLSGELANTNF